MQEHENVEKAPNLHISKGWYGVGKKVYSRTSLDGRYWRYWRRAQNRRLLFVLCPSTSPQGPRAAADWLLCLGRPSTAYSARREDQTVDAATAWSGTLAGGMFGNTASRRICQPPSANRDGWVPVARPWCLAQPHDADSKWAAVVVSGRMLGQVGWAGGRLLGGQHELAATMQRHAACRWDCDASECASHRQFPAWPRTTDCLSVQSIVRRTRLFPPPKASRHTLDLTRPPAHNLTPPHPIFPFSRSTVERDLNERAVSPLPVS
ncbi:hypothetical protein CIB48_g10893 [Xylaria polymorpha]|nr:hypothetical protein CIB48_g10893 [Xylaria polymorpha]